ncbi:MAG: hypothetical protein RMK18_11000 [Armatimonadota bacterium]|nr:hypothetical protein [Armatimonadota bacterium]MCX7778379.1 hypothetical protein [Armatimonadota bacterium]MDW8026374.1 hypothetical protein [Armatimonadota bacterium]
MWRVTWGNEHWAGLTPPRYRFVARYEPNWRCIQRRTVQKRSIGRHALQILKQTMILEGGYLELPKKRCIPDGGSPEPLKQIIGA